MKKSVQNLLKSRLPGKKTLNGCGNRSLLTSEELWERLSGFPLVGEGDRKELRAIVAASAALATAKSVSVARAHTFKVLT